MRTALIAAALAAAGAARGAPLDAGPETGRILVNVGKSGLFSAFAHDHVMEVTRWRARAEVPDGDPARASVEVTLDATSLRERNERLSEDDRRQIERDTAGRRILDAARHPEIVFRADRVTVAPPAAGGATRGTLHGTLTLHGTTRAVDLPFEASREGAGWRVRGEVRLEQTDYGIEPFRTMGGTVGVKDAVVLDLAITFRPAAAAAR